MGQLKTKIKSNQIHDEVWTAIDDSIEVARLTEAQRSEAAIAFLTMKQGHAISHEGLPDITNSLAELAAAVETDNNGLVGAFNNLNTELTTTYGEALDLANAIKDRKTFVYRFNGDSGDLTMGGTVVDNGDGTVSLNYRAMLGQQAGIVLGTGADEYELDSSNGARFRLIQNGLELVEMSDQALGLLDQSADGDWKRNASAQADENAVGGRLEFLALADEDDLVVMVEVIRADIAAKATAFDFTEVAAPVQSSYTVAGLTYDASGNIIAASDGAGQQ
jgi:hypothetical protein